MALETRITITDYNVDSKSGHISVKVKSQTTDGNQSWEGPEMVYGVDAVSFVNRFHSNIEEFEAWVSSQHQQYRGASQQLIDALQERKGKIIG